MSPALLVPEAYGKRCYGPSAGFPSVEAGLPCGAYLRERVGVFEKP